MRDLLLFSWEQGNALLFAINIINSNGKKEKGWNSSSATFFCNQESENVAQQINGKEDEKRMRAVKLNKLRSLLVFFLFQISNEKVKAPLMMNLWNGAKEGESFRKKEEKGKKDKRKKEIITIIRHVSVYHQLRGS